MNSKLYVEYRTAHYDASKKHQPEDTPTKTKTIAVCLLIWFSAALSKAGTASASQSPTSNKGGPVSELVQQFHDFGVAVWDTINYRVLRHPRIRQGFRVPTEKERRPTKKTAERIQKLNATGELPKARHQPFNKKKPAKKKKHPRPLVTPDERRFFMPRIT